MPAQSETRRRGSAKLDRRAGRGPGVCRRRQFRTIQRFDLLPDTRIAFDFYVGLHEDAIPPGVGIATDGLRGIILAEISQDLCARGVGGANRGPSVEQTVALIEIDGL